MRALMRARALVVLLVACGSSSTPSNGNDAASDDAIPPAKHVTVGHSAWERAGAHPVGHAIFTATDTARSRTLTIEAWYPADESARAAAEAGTALEDHVEAGADHDALAAKLAAAPDCTRKRTRSARDVTPLAGAPWPLVVFSHCHACMRFSSAEIAERLASHGVAVIAPDHAGDTWFDHRKGVDAPLDASTLTTRVADVRFTLDVALSGNDPLPSALRGKFDATKVGMMGHSFGGVTTGAVLVKDARFVSGFVIAAPFDLFGGPDVTTVHMPLFFMLAQEDNSISEIGDDLIRRDFRDGNAPVALGEVVDAGHWSFSDIAGLDDVFTPGCGTAIRQTDQVSEFTYLDNEGARGLAASYAVAFFASTLLGDADAKSFVATSSPPDIITVSSR